MGNIYLIYGDDEYLKNEKLKEITNGLSIENSMDKITFFTPSFEELYSEITHPTITISDKLIIVINRRNF